MNLRPPGYEAVSRANRSHFGSDLCFLPPFARRIFRCFRPGLPVPFWAKTGSEAVERISGATDHTKKICLKSPKMKKHLHRTFACGASFCRAENGRKRGRAAPIAFHAKKTTFRAVLRTKRREGAIIGTERKNPPGDAPRARRGGPYGIPPARGRSTAGGE